MQIKNPSRSPYGERGLKYEDDAQLLYPVSRSPYGERGLKLNAKTTCEMQRESLPVWGAWIEIMSSYASES